MNGARFIVEPVLTANLSLQFLRPIFNEVHYRQLLCGLVALLLSSLSVLSSCADPLDHWTRTSVGAPVLLRGLAYGNGHFVAVGDGGSIYLSSNALSWTVSQSPAIGSLRAVAFGSGHFAVAEGDIYDSSPRVLTSSDGMNWIRKPSAFHLANIVFGKGLFIGASGDYQIGTSLDALQWQFQNVDSQTLGIGISDSLFVVTGDHAAYTSETGSNWIGKAPMYTGPMAYGNGVFIGVELLNSALGIPQATTDGSEWIDSQTPGPGFRWGAVAFAHDTFVLVGDSGVILTSTTGTNWVERVPGQFYDASFAFVSYANGRAVIVGVNGVVLVSDHYGPPILKISSNPDLRLNVSAEKNKLCVIEQSQDLIHWSELTRYTNTTQSADVTGLDPTNPATLFRAVTLE